MACCLTPSCCPTRRSTSGSTKRVRPVPEKPAVLPPGECVKLCSPQPLVKQSSQYQVAATAKPPPPRVMSVDDESPAAKGEVNDFMATFFKNCEEIVRNNQGALHQALLLDDGACHTAGCRRSDNQLAFNQSSLSSSSLSSPISDEQLLRPVPSSMSAPATVETQSCRQCLQYNDDARTTISSSSSAAVFAGQHTAAFVAPANSPVSSSSPLAPSSECDAHCSSSAPVMFRSAETVCRNQQSTMEITSSSSRTRPTKKRCCQGPEARASTSTRRPSNLPWTSPRHYNGLGSRPPCLGQEGSPIRSTPCGAGPVGMATPDDHGRLRYHHCLVQSSPIDLDITAPATDADAPPPPVVQRSCQKVGLWLRRLEREVDGDDVTDVNLSCSNAVESANRSPAVVVIPESRSAVLGHRRRAQFPQQLAHLRQRKLGVGSKRMSGDTDVDPVSAISPCRVRRQVITAGSSHSDARRSGRQTRYPVAVDVARRRSAGVTGSRKSYGGVRLPSSSIQRRKLSSAAWSWSATTSSGWLADRSSSIVTPSGECESNVAHTPLHAGDRAVFRRLKRSADRSKDHRRQQLVARRIQQCVRDVDRRSAGSGLYVETLAVL